MFWQRNGVRKAQAAKASKARAQVEHAAMCSAAAGATKANTHVMLAKGTKRKHICYAQQKVLKTEKKCARSATSAKCSEELIVPT